MEGARKQFLRFDEAWEGAEWLLARNPTPDEAFLSLSKDGVDYWICGRSAESTPDSPDLWIFYTFDENQVVIHGISAFEPPSDSEEV